MQISGFYVVEIPIITKERGNHKQSNSNQDKPHFMHGNGCKDWEDCLSCPKFACDWQAYPKSKR